MFKSEPFASLRKYLLCCCACSWLFSLFILSYRISDLNVLFHARCDANEKEMMLERQSVMERQRSLSEAQKKLLDEQALLNQREADILNKSQVLRRIEKELEAEKENITVEQKALNNGAKM